MAIKLNENFVKLAETQGNLTIYEQFADYFVHFMDETQGKKLGVYDREVSLAEKDMQMLSAFKEEVQRLSQVDISDIKNKPNLVVNPMVSWASMSVVSNMVDAVLPLTVVQSTGLYTDTKIVGYGQTAQFDVEPNSLFTVSQGGNAQRVSFIQKQFKNTITINPVNHALTVQVSMYKVLCGLESLGEFVRKAVISMETAMTVDAYNALTEGLKASTFPKELTITGYTREGLLALCQRVQAYNQGAKPVIVGTAVALSNILPNGDDGYRIVTEGDNMSIQLIKNFYGFDVLVLPQVAVGDAEYNLLLNDKEIYVLSTGTDKLIKGVLEGSTVTNTNDFYDTANLMSNATLNKRWQFEVITNAVAGICKLS